VYSDSTIGIHVYRYTTYTLRAGWPEEQDEIVHRALCPELYSESQFSFKIAEHACIRYINQHRYVCW
jgi:hypothetical protein